MQRAQIEESFGHYSIAEELYLKYMEEYYTAQSLGFLITMCLNMGDAGRALGFINLHEKNFKESKFLKRHKAKILEIRGDNTSALKILEDLYNTNPLNGHYILPLVKVLLNLSKDDKEYLEKAEKIIDISYRANPKSYIMQAKILVMIQKEDFLNAEKILFREFPDEDYGLNVYINGLKAMHFMKKASSSKEQGIPIDENTLRKALEYTELGFSLSNVPLLWQRMEILQELGEIKLIEDTKKKILEINPNIPMEAF